MYYQLTILISFTSLFIFTSEFVLLFPVAVIPTLSNRIWWPYWSTLVEWYKQLVLLIDPTNVLETTWTHIFGSKKLLRHAIQKWSSKYVRQYHAPQSLLTGWKTKIFWHSPDPSSLLYSLYKIPLDQACFPITRPNFHSHLTRTKIPHKILWESHNKLLRISVVLPFLIVGIW